MHSKHAYVLNFDAWIFQSIWAEVPNPSWQCSANHGRDGLLERLVRCGHGFVSPCNDTVFRYHRRYWIQTNKKITKSGARWTSANIIGWQCELFFVRKCCVGVNLFSFWAFQVEKSGRGRTIRHQCHMSSSHCWLSNQYALRGGSPPVNQGHKCIA